MFEHRAYGRLRPPTGGQLERYAARHHLDLTEEDRAVFAGAVAGFLAGFDRLEELDGPVVGSPHHLRDPGGPPSAGEDPFNAFTRLCRVEGAPSGRLAGRRLAVKDCIAVAGVPMTNGGRRQPVFVPTEDAVVVERALDEGAVVVGKTNLEDMALGLGEGSYFGAARNPMNPRFSTGGSSSGSAAAVAGGLADMALGTDDAGSVRLPAAWCGIVGMKATHGLVPTYGMAYFDPSLDHIGPMTSSVADNALLLEVLAGPDWRDQSARVDRPPVRYTEMAGRPVGSLRAGVLQEAVDSPILTEEIGESFTRARSQLESLGCVVEPVHVPLWPEALAIELAVMAGGLHAMVATYGQGSGHWGRMSVEATAANAAQLRLAADDLPPFMKAVLLSTEHLKEAYLGVHFAMAQNLRAALARQIDEALSTVDVLITPTCPTPPFELLDRPAGAGEMLGRMFGEAAANTCPLDLSGHPAITVPCGIGAHDLPIGLQIVGRRFDEATVYRTAFAFEARQLGVG
ncbi:MAG TPA: amidase family protein [Acidimicrobiales bacterium]|jgi:amidase|nr:amidase family protein [Acidimicrobiales bacterium]